MKTPTEVRLKQRINRWLWLFIILLVISGVTAFPIETELNLLMANITAFPLWMQHWLSTIHTAVKQTNTAYPYLAYGTDWLAFAHLVIAVAFIGPLRDPVRNIWVIQFGMIACVMVLLLAFIAGPVRHIPLFWQLIDCSFGVLGFIPLYLVYKLIKQLELQQTTN